MLPKFRAIIHAIGLLAIVGLFVSIPYLSGGRDMWLSPPKLSTWVKVPRTGKNPSGTFKLEYRLFGFGADGTGGACMITDIAKVIRAKDADCEPQGSAQKWKGYCVPEGRCWYRPAADSDEVRKAQLCETSGYYRKSTDPADRGPPWQVGAVQNLPNTPGFDLRQFYEDHTNRKPTRWRVSGLLFGRSGSRHMRYGDPACLSVDQQKC